MRNRENYNRYQNEYMNNRSLLLKLRAIEYKGGKCIHCGYDRYYGAMQFHHRDSSSKEMNWNKLRSKKWETIQKELDKCDLLCSNCHAEEHEDKSVKERFLEWQRSMSERKKLREQSQILGSAMTCQACGDSFVLKQGDKTTRKYCSRACTYKARRLNLPSNEIKALAQDHSVAEIARIFGVSQHTIRRRILAG